MEDHSFGKGWGWFLLTDKQLFVCCSAIVWARFNVGCYIESYSCYDVGFALSNLYRTLLDLFIRAHWHNQHTICVLDWIVIISLFLKILKYNHPSNFKLGFGRLVLWNRPTFDSPVLLQFNGAVYQCLSHCTRTLWCNWSQSGMPTTHC